MFIRWQHKKKGQKLMGLLLEKKLYKQGKENFRKEILVVRAIEKSTSIRTWERTLHLELESTISVTWKGQELYKKGFVLLQRYC